MRVYLDNCCYNRPFDDQNQLKVRLEAEAKLRIQYLMRIGVLEYAWSDMLSQEVSDNPNRTRREKIFPWMDGATTIVGMTPEVVSLARDLEGKGLRNADALHVASAFLANCDWFFTTDSGILKKLRFVGAMRIANPVEFIVEDTNDNG